jgi:predicted ATPase
MRIVQLHLTNFLSYRNATLELGDLTALVGPNAAGKSNAVAALRLLREIPTYGLQTAIARRGGFDQLRHRSEGRPYDPGLRLDFQLPSAGTSNYELRLGALQGKRYEVKLENGEVIARGGRRAAFSHRGEMLTIDPASLHGNQVVPEKLPPIPDGQSALPAALNFGGIEIWELLGSLQTVEINPSKVKELQDPSPPQEFEPDGSNTASFLEALDTDARAELVAQVSAIVPGIERIEPRHVADKMTIMFYQEVAGRIREFSAKQMSDGTLRTFGILLALLQPRRPPLVVIEEPETAIHLGALRTLVDVLRAYSKDSQILLTTHSADIVDNMSLDELRVVWSDGGSSHIAPVAKHTRGPVKKGLITPGELLRSDALDPAVV